MRIKLAILENDQSYLNRIVNVFNTKYSDKFEIYSFTDMAVAITTLSNAKIDVFIADEYFDINFESIPKRCGFAYFVESQGIETINEQRAICKFQRAELIYKQILGIYSENAGNVSGLKIDDHSTKLIAFSSPSGGVGTSSMAAACALHFASKSKKVLYLNLEKYGSSDVFFLADGQFDMSDIIYALKSKKANLAMKLESCVKQDDSGVYFYSQSKVALDMLELNTENIERLISEIKLTGSYDYIILDMDFAITKEVVKVYKKTHAVVWVGDGSEISNLKIQRAYSALTILEQNAEASLINRLSLIYNKFSNKSSKTVGDIGLKNMGGAPVYMHATSRQVVEQISAMNMFDKII